MTLVITTKGLLDINLLTVKDEITLEENSRVTATEWYYDGELVRRDVNVNILRGLETTNHQENFNA